MRNLRLCSEADNGPFKVYRIVPQSNEQMDVLRWLRNNAVEYEVIYFNY